MAIVLWPKCASGILQTVVIAFLARLVYFLSLWGPKRFSVVWSLFWSDQTIFCRLDFVWGSTYIICRRLALAPNKKVYAKENSEHGTNFYLHLFWDLHFWGTLLTTPSERDACWCVGLFFVAGQTLEKVPQGTLSTVHSFDISDCIRLLFFHRNHFRW